MSRDRLAVATINLAAFTANIQAIKRLIGENVQYMAVLKANAYGHGLERMATAAVEAGADYLAVVSLGELKRVRAAGVEAPILIINYIDTESVEDALKLNAALTVFDSEVIDAATRASQRLGIHCKLHLKVDTGMHRAGCDPSEALSLAQRIQSSEYCELEGMYTHFAESESADDSFTASQLAVFDQTLHNLADHGMNPPIIHAANSAAAIAHANSRFNMVRVGLASFGINPFEREHAMYGWCEKSLASVLSLHAPIVHIRTIQSGESVGYNRRWTADSERKIALVPIGYGDGIRRAPHNDPYVLVRGTRAPIVGAISMDQISIDVTNVPDVQFDDDAVFIGTSGDRTIQVEDLASKYETISYEVMTSLSDRIERNYY